MYDDQMVLIAFGAILGFALSMLAEWARRIWDGAERRGFGRQLLAAIIAEVDEGASRTRGIAGLLDKDLMSFSRIYTALWDSARTQLVQSTRELAVPTALPLLHRIYYRFDLINLHMERGEFARGGAFAKEYASELEQNVSALKQLLSKNGITVSTTSA